MLIVYYSVNQELYNLDISVKKDRKKNEKKVKLFERHVHDCQTPLDF